MNPAQNVPVSKALYHATNKPELGKSAPFDSGFCGVCREATHVAPAAAILTSTFGSWDDIAVDITTKHRYLCLPCAWAFRARELKHHPTIVRVGATTLLHPNGTTLRSYLNGPIPSDMAILLPINGKKSFAPWAQWGKLTVDSGPMDWNRRLARATQMTLDLKALGFNELHLRDESPSFNILDRLPATQHAAVHQSWRALDPFRGDKTLFPVLLKASREKM